MWPKRKRENVTAKPLKNVNKSSNEIPGFKSVFTLFVRVYLRSCIKYIYGKCLATTVAINLTKEPFTHKACMSAPERWFHLLLFFVFVLYAYSHLPKPQLEFSHILDIVIFNSIEIEALPIYYRLQCGFAVTFCC